MIDNELDYLKRDAISPLPAEERPGFYELQRNAEANIAKRGIARYFITQNYERSLKWHQRLGMPVVRKVVMGTMGRAVSRPGRGGNYRLDHRKSPMEAATNFAIKGSVANEVIHTAVAMPLSIDAANAIIDGRIGAGAIENAWWAGFNLALVALQRYNRARMVKRVDQELKEGNTFRPGYENYLGIDARAVENYESSLAGTNDQRDAQLETERSLPTTSFQTHLQQKAEAGF